MEAWAGALVNLGIGGVGLYLFVKGVLLSSVAVAQIVALLDARIDEWRERYVEMREDRDAWRELALGTEQTLDVARPIVKQALGLPVPARRPRRAGQRALEEGYTAGDQERLRQR